jgi:DNA-directed RNA polymerase specialized sigma24 family protein
MSQAPAVASEGSVDPTSSVTFDEFVAARSRALLRTAYLLTHDHALAEDLLQTSLAKAWFAWKRIDGRPEPYVRKILVNTYASWWRRKWNGEQPTEELPENAVDEASERRARRAHG